MSVTEAVPRTQREQRGWSWYDWANSAFSTTVVTVFLGPYLLSVVEAAEAAGQRITLLGVLPVSADSYYPYVVTLSVILQVVLMPIVGGIADTSGSKRMVLGVSAYVGALATMGLFFLDGRAYQLGGICFIIANVAFGCAAVVANSFLPDIAAPEERDRVSARAWAMGYVGGILLLIANLALFLGHAALGVSEGDAVRISLLSAGAWWALFTIIPLRRLRNRPPAAHHVGGGLRQLGATLRELPRYPMAMLFLIAFFFFNDGIQTVIGLTAVYATQELELPTMAVIAAVVVVQIVGIVGALTMARLAARHGAKRVVLASLGAWALLLVAAYLLPVGQLAPFIAVGGAIGFVLGGTQALSRSLFAQLIPRSREASYFSLYEVSNGASSILGPLVFGLSLQFLGSYRIAIVMLVVFFAVGALLLARVDTARGVADAASAP